MSYYNLTPLAGGALSVNITISSPIARAIQQRNGSNQASVSISGSFTGSAGSIRARLSPLPGYNSGTLTSWNNLTVSGSSFSGTVTGTGGWYQLQLQALSPSATLVGFQNLDKVAIGDIFLMCGQSVSANFAGSGQPLNRVSDDRISMTDISVFPTWSLANDSQLNIGPAPGTLSSIWSFFGSTLIQTTNVPIGMVNLAIGNTAAAQWVPGAGTGYYASYISPAVQLFPANGFRAFLWGQGESDATDNTSQASYFSSLSSIISQLRTDAGWTVPIGMCDTETYESGSLPGQANVQAAQQQLISSISGVFAGADTDSVGSGSQYRYDGTHPTLLGASIMGNLWSAAVVTAFGF